MTEGELAIAFPAPVSEEVTAAMASNSDLVPDDELAPEPYPGTVVSIIDQVAGIVLLLAVLGGVLWSLVAITDKTVSDGEKVAGAVIGVGVIVLGAVQWAFMRAVSLALVYLWRIHIDLWGQED